MDPAPPRGDTPTRRRHAAPDGPATSVVDPSGDDVRPDGGYDGYDGRYSRRVPAARTPSTAVIEPGTTRLPADTTRLPTGARAQAGTRGPDRRTPARPDRRGRTRAAVAAEVPSQDAPSQDVPSRGAAAARRVGIGVLVGALLMLVVATTDSLFGGGMPMLGSFAAPGPGAEQEQAAPLPPPPDTPGVCLNWTRSDATDTAAVDCTRSHLFEQAGSVALADQPTFPTDQGWQKLVADRCTPVATGYLKGRFDPDGKFRIGALKPSVQRWNGGDKGMRCGLQSASRSGAMLPIVGTVASQDQSAVVPAGSCLGIDGRTVGDPVGCDKPHAVEAVSVVDMGQQFKQGPPTVQDQDAFLQPACQKAANDYAGNDQVIAQRKLTVYWDNLSAPSWNAGSHKVNCNLATLLPDGSGFAAITGSVKGAMTIAGQPAPPAAGPGGPGGPSTSGAPGSSSGGAVQGGPGGPGVSSGAPNSPGSGTGAGAPPPLLPNLPQGLPGLAP